MSTGGVLARRSTPRRVGLAAGGSVAALLAVVAGGLCGAGWLYVLRGAGLFAAGPKIGDALPLLQLAGFDAQPLLRVAVAWLIAGGLTGLALVWLGRPWRVLLAGALVLGLLLLASEASYALARNVRFTAVLQKRGPGAGPWVEAVAFAAGCGLAGKHRRGVGRPTWAGTLGGRGELSLGGGQDGHAPENDGDRSEVSDDRSGVRA